MGQAGPQPLQRPDLTALVAGKLSRSFRLDGVHSVPGAMLFSSHYLDQQRPILWVTKDNEAAEVLAETFRFFLPGDRQREVLVLPGLETDPYSGLSPHPDLASRRASVLARLLKGFQGILITPATGLSQKTVSADLFRRHCRTLQIGEPVARDSLILGLRSMGYVREDPVSQAGEFSFRGGIVDIFPPSDEAPVRIEFFGDEVESIRRFDPSTQRSIGLIDTVEVLPMRELTPTSAEVAVWHMAAPRHWSEVRFAQRLSEYRQFTENGELFNGFEYLMPLVVPLRATVLDYVKAHTDEPVIVLEEPDQLYSLVDEQWKRSEEAYKDCDLEGIPALQPSAFFIQPSEIRQMLGDRYFGLLRLGSEETSVERFDFRPAMKYRGRVQDALADVTSWRQQGDRVVFVMNSEGMAERLVRVFREYEMELTLAHEGFQAALAEPAAAVTVGHLRAGFSSPELGLHLISEQDLFGERMTRRIEAPRGETLGVFVSDFRDLHAGDLVVHVDHGIGVFRGLESVGVGEQTSEYVLLEYSGGAKLYVPVDRLDLLQKYSSAGGKSAQIDRLGGVSWKRTKARIKKSMQNLAEDLIKLYAQREVAQGHAFQADDELMHEFEAAFEYEETPDQQAAIEALKKDMESVRPMDRLICGDVGYGKTEVAMRAAFKAVADGKQVALLAPTTVLAFQHLNTFRERFSGFPVRIEMVSRFIARNKQKELLEQVKLGLVDILIGTHRLLSKDVAFSDLGLIVVDEEQRFGVTQKEKLKALRSKVDVITLSATPIPRTLNMSLVGIRDLSIIETAPRDRLSIQTVVVKFSQHIIRSAIDLELKRDGQVFLVHNSVETIHSIAALLRRIVPEARIAVGHGQMREDALEKVMLDFVDHRYDILVCTTIIENGLDIPRANTIIVNRADRFGLSQLYQLRGRVGRSSRRAYAYFLIPEEEALTGDAQRRLAAIREFSDLGSGFRLAALDLEIRGAGNLLGGEQSGHIDAVGFELYMKLLEEAVRELRGEAGAEEVRTTIDLRLDIQIPEHYIDDSNLRLWLYKRVSSVRDQKGLDGLRDEIVDRFGKYPRPVANLFSYARLRLAAQKLRVTAIERKGSQIRFRFRDDTPISPEKVIQFVNSTSGLSFSTDGALIASIDGTDGSFVFERATGIVGQLTDYCGDG